MKQGLRVYAPFDARHLDWFGGARRDEEKSRAKERIFSFHDAHHGWDPKNQRPELWKSRLAPSRITCSRKHTKDGDSVEPSGGPGRWPC